jgi:Tol biopolymer transport system component
MRTKRFLRGVALTAATAAGLAGLLTAPAHAISYTYPGANGRILIDQPGSGGVDTVSLDPVTGTRLVEKANTNTLSSSYSPNGSRIAYTVAGENRIRVRSAAGGAETILTTSPGAAIPVGQLVWSPDGNQLAYIQVNSSSSQVLYTLGSTTVPTAPRQLTSTGALAMHPSWSPDSRMVAYLKYTTTNNTDVFMTPSDPATGGTTQITNDPLLQWGPMWSPNGDRIAYTVSDLVAKTNGVGVTGMFKSFGIFWTPGGSGLVVPMSGRVISVYGALAWSPDSLKLTVGFRPDAIAPSKPDDGISVFTVPPFGTGTWPEFRTKIAMDAAPVLWSPDGTKLAYRPIGKNELWVKSATDTLPGTKLLSAWSFPLSWQRK